MIIRVRRKSPYHLLDPVEALPVKTEGLFKQDFVLHGPLIRKGSEVRKVSKGLLNVMLMPEQHAKRLGRKTPLYSNGLASATLRS